jgi:hypothetical protein
MDSPEPALGRSNMRPQALPYRSCLFLHANSFRPISPNPHPKMRSRLTNPTAGSLNTDHPDRRLPLSAPPPPHNQQSRKHRLFLSQWGSRGQEPGPTPHVDHSPHLETRPTTLPPTAHCPPKTLVRRPSRDILLHVRAAGNHRPLPHLVPQCNRLYLRAGSTNSTSSPQTAGFPIKENLPVPKKLFNLPAGMEGKPASAMAVHPHVSSPPLPSEVLTQHR